MAVRNLAPGEWAVLALLAERPAHGWALAAELGPGGELGSVWSLGRPLVYRSIEILADRGLIEPAGHEPGERGPNRTIFRATDAGRAALAQWLSEPVEHVREVRSLLLLKLIVAERAGFDPAPMLAAQHETVAAALRSLEARASASAGSEAILLRFRLESTRAVLRFVEGLLARPGSGLQAAV
ncbi:MAG TPA: PadR family transcriptional regulator [Gaiellaceae bacterium]|nr:PadR family transcriptional regulator [Gaiellaceae bacterium]